jgi:retinol dehydrogenase-12
VINPVSASPPFNTTKDDTNPVVINCLDPCFCSTSLARNTSGAGKKLAFQIFSRLFARTPEEGSRCVVLAASAGRETHGKYMRAGLLKDFAPMILSEEGKEREEYVWGQVGKKLEEICPGVTRLIKTA